MNPADKFRHHHQELIDTFNGLITTLRERNDEELEPFKDFLYDELLPHAEAEEAELYSAIDELAGTELATASMRADHNELEQRIDNFDFSEITNRFLQSIDQFEALLLNHFRKEEEVLLLFVSEQLTENKFNKLLETVHSSEENLR